MATRSTTAAAALPRPPTPFVGRITELEKLQERLLQPDCRLLTLLGPGGIGKTRLALEGARRVRASFPDGAYFVPLQGVEDPQLLAPSVADALQATLSGPEAPQQQLLAYLQHKSLLLLLDNFEQLLDSAAFLAKLLAAARGLKLLVTSREVLNLQEEWLYPLAGLAVPANLEDEDWQRHDAVQLFLARARRVRPGFSLEAEAGGVLRLCQLVEGLPLALELAAPWLRTLSCEEIAVEIERSRSFLASSHRNIPERHRSIDAVFEHSWRTLSAAERDTFARLAIFRGDFNRRAAQEVAGATLPVLSSLVDKSLVRREAEGGRYHIHELLRQCGQEQLTADPETLADARARHGRYYIRFLGERGNDLIGDRQPEALAEIAAELPNVRQAWRWAVEQRQAPALEYAALTLHTFYQYQGRFQEGVDAFAAAVEAVEAMTASPERTRALAVLLTWAGWLEMRFGRVEAATALQQRALALYEALDRLPAPGAGTDPLTALAILAVLGGNHEQAQTYGTLAWERAAARGDRQNMAYAGYALASAALAQAHIEEALHHAQRAVALTRTTGNRWFRAYIYNHLGQIYQALGDNAAAHEYYRRSYAIKESFGDPEGMALALAHLGDLALAEGQLEDARRLYERSNGLYEKLGDRGGLLRTYQGLAESTWQGGDLETAARYFELGVRTAAGTQVLSASLSILAAAGEFLVAAGAPARGLGTLSVVAEHPAADSRTRRRALAQVQALADEAAEERAPQVVLPDAPRDLETALLLTASELAALPDERETVAKPAPSAPALQPLLEPLSDRELEVLALIAAGLKNREIAERLTVALSTVKSHINNIYGKLSVSNRVQAVSRAQELGLL